MDVVIDLLISPGWHINAHRNAHRNAHGLNQDDLIETRVDLRDDNWQMDSVSYPDGVERLLGFNDAPLNLYEERVKLNITIRPPENVMMPVVLPLAVQAQACSNDICLPPEHLLFKLTAMP